MVKDIVLFVNAIRPATFAALGDYKEQTGRIFVPVIIVDTKIKNSITERNAQQQLAEEVMTLEADFDSPSSIREVLRPYQDRIFAITSQYENSIYELKKLVPYFPYLPTPTEKSHEWATEKKLMRELLEVHGESLVPRYLEVADASEATIAKVEQTMQYPLIVKPSGLEGSLLVSMVTNTNDLKTTLTHIFDEIQKGYDTWIKRQTPAVLVEEFMEGDMYSIDTYISPTGKCRHTPPVKVVTGYKAGFEDFFGYIRLVPAGLSEDNITAATIAAEHACRALGLRSITAHIELMRTKDGWKIIELGPRIGGYRHDMYRLSYGINHIVNDILNRAGEVPEVPTEVLSHTVVFNIYAHQEGVLKSIDGVEKVQQLASFIWLKQALHVGDKLLFAKNNGDPVFEILLSHKDQQQLEADMQTLEQTLHLQVF